MDKSIRVSEAAWLILRQWALDERTTMRALVERIAIAHVKCAGSSAPSLGTEAESVGQSIIRNWKPGPGVTELTYSTDD